MSIKTLRDTKIVFQDMQNIVYKSSPAERVVLGNGASLVSLGKRRLHIANGTGSFDIGTAMVYNKGGSFR
jgi:hypothetical protein